MKLNKQKVIALALAVCLIATLSMGSLAWFTDDDSVTNDFFIAGSEDQNPDDVFSVDVWEKDDPNSSDKIQDGIKYPDILPGDDLYKEVNVENTGAYAQYIRTTVTVTDAHIWQAIYGEHFVALDKIATDLNPAFTTYSIICDEVNDTLTYVLYYENILAVDEVVTLFTNVAIPEDLNREQAAEMAGGFQINVVAEAVQTENVGNNAVEAFETVGMAVEAGNRCILKDATIETNNEYVIRENTILENVTINSTEAGLQTKNADVVLENVVINAGSNADYANILNGGTVVYNEVDVAAVGGGIGATDGVQVEFNSGSLIITGATTNPRYNFYVVGGSEVTINGGTFDFTSKTLKRAYIYAEAGSTVTINGGTFGAASTRSGYTAGILGEGTVVITGGTFGFNPSAWVADGYEAVQNGTTWTVQAK